jgi:hypothetical protein
MKLKFFLLLVTVTASHTVAALSYAMLNLTTVSTIPSGLLTSDILLQSTDDVNATDMPSAPTGNADESHVMQYILIPLGIIILLSLLALTVIRCMIDSWDI